MIANEKHIKSVYSIVKPELVRRKLQEIDKYLTYLENVRAYPQNKLLENTEIWASAERFLQMTIKSVNNIANHIIADENLGIIDRYRNMPKIFLREDFINEELEKKWIQMIGFRNILVHGYAKIDRTEVYKILQHNLNDFKELRKVFSQFL